MVTLTQAASYSKKVVIYAVFLTIFIILVVIALGLVRDYLKAQIPEPDIVTTNGFGKLPKLVFPQENNRPAILTLQTIQGGVPEASSVARIYKTISNPPGLLASSKAQQFARLQGFNPTPTTKTAIEHVFNDSLYPARILTYNLATGNFDLTYNLEQDNSPILTSKISADSSQILEEAITLLQSSGKFTPSLESGTQKIAYYKYLDNEYALVQNKLEANLVRVNFFTGPIDGMNIKTPNPDQSSVYVTFSGKDNRNQRIIQFHYLLFPVDVTSLQTYPIKAGNIAWEELVSGKGYVVNIGTGNQAQVFVRDTYFAFYDPGELHEYLQPIYVFIGDRGFEAYVQAIDPVWVE